MARPPSGCVRHRSPPNGLRLIATLKTWPWAFATGLPWFEDVPNARRPKYGTGDEGQTKFTRRCEEPS
jgi:hypothetical protein